MLVSNARTRHEGNFQCELLDTYSTFKEILECRIFFYSKKNIFSGRIFQITSQNGQNLGFEWIFSDFIRDFGFYKGNFFRFGKSDPKIFIFLAKKN